jgi:pimeloyl-ACP methyl ester carboxylesterase
MFALLGMTFVMLVVAGSAVSGAAAAGCAGTPGLLCSQVEVPLDRSGQTPGSISLHVEVLPPSGTSRGAVFLIAGGPGQPSAGVFALGSPTAAAGYRLLFPGYTLIAYDTRGTGQSTPIDCSFSDAQSAPEAGAACAASLGAQRDFYGTGDQVEDLEAVRQTLGFDRVALWGTSYGTKLAVDYALAHPTHVERLLLDSVVPPELPDPLAANTLRMIPTALANFCATPSCRAADPDFAGDVVSLANGLETKPLVGQVLRASGSKKLEVLDGLDLLSLVIAADLNPGLAAELPAAVHAARLGSAQPLLRIEELTTLGSSGQSADDVSSAVYAATVCHDGPFPWQPSTPVADRTSVLVGAIAALPAGTLGPFGSWAAALGTAPFCAGWPGPTSGAPLGAGPLPDVPVLALSGGFDMRTPTVDAASVVARFPQGHLLVVPGIGHDVLQSSSFCAVDAVRSWIAGDSVPASCPRPAALAAPVAAYSAGKPAATSAARVQQTLTTAANTLREAEAAWLLLVESGESTVAAPGLYSGQLTTSSRNLSLTAYSIAPGVTITGHLKIAALTYPLTFSGKLVVAGARASLGTLTASKGHLSGTLAGKHVSG